MTTTTDQLNIPALPDEPEASPTLETVPVDDSGINWAEEAGEMGDNSPDDVVLAVEGDAEILDEPEEVVAPVVETAPVVAPVAPAADATPEVPVTPPVAEAPQAPVAPHVPFDLAKWEAEQLTGLEQLYTINAADGEKLQTEPELILPKLAANMHMTITKSLLTAVQAMIPDYVVQHNAAVSADTQARDAFYSVNSDLRAHEQAVLQVAKVFRAANPNAPREVAIKTIGDMVRMSLGLQAPAAQAPAQTLQQVITPPANRPFTPAKGGGPAPAKAINPWDEFLD